MSADPSRSRSQLEAALSRWENEGGARAPPQLADRSQRLEISQAIDTELEHLHVRMIAMENLLIAMLAQAPDQPRALAREMATFISPRPGFTHHPRTLGAAAQMVHLVERAWHFQGWVEGELLS
ncbi:MAG: hypothetical protein ABIN08_14895 [Caldimonas sp.]